MVAVPYGNLFLKAEGAGTEVDPAIVEVALRVRRQTGYGEIGSSFPLPVYRSPLTAFPFASGAGNREVLPAPPSGQRYLLESLFLSSLSGTGTIDFEQDDGDTYLNLGIFPVSPRVMASPIPFSLKLLLGAAIIAYPSNTGIVYGGFFLGQIV